MAKTIDQMIQSAVRNGAVKKSNFNSGVRQIGLEYIQDGDIVTIPADFQVLEAKISRNSDDTAEYIFVTVNRGGTTKIVPLYPSLFWKTRRVYDKENKKWLDEWRTSNGEVVDFMQDQVSIEDGFKAIAARGPIKITMDKFVTLRFGEEEGGKTQAANIPTITWA